MTTVKAKLHICRENKCGRYSLVVQIIHRRQRRLLPTGIKITLPQFNETTQKIAYLRSCGQTHKEIRAMNDALREVLSAVRKRIGELTGTPFTAEDISTWYKMRGDDSYLFTYFEKMIADKIAEHKIGISKAYCATVHSLKAFRGSPDIRFSEIDFRFLNEYEHFLLSGGLSLNTVAYYMRNLRTAYNRAEAEGVFRPSTRSPFHKFRLSVAKTIKRALSTDTVRRLAELDLTSFPRQAFARDLFMASFYLRGMPFVDLIHLRNENVINGNVVYCRRKTGVPVVIGIVPPLQLILDRYASRSEYLFPCLSDKATDKQEQYEQYRKCLCLYNRNLKHIGRMLEINIPLTGYVARHSWATQAKNKGASTTIISEGLGHASEKITQVYLKSFDSGILDSLNSRVAQLK